MGLNWNRFIVGGAGDNFDNVSSALLSVVDCKNVPVAQQQLCQVQPQWP